jgi:hypothetical protein
VPESIARLSSSEGEERGITMDSGASLHFLTEETTATIDFREQFGPVEITVDTVKKGETFRASKACSAGNMSELGDDVASIGRFDKDNSWWTVFGGGECVVYDGDPSDRSKPMPIEVAKGQLGSEYMYRVPLRDLVKAIRVPTERILRASATPPETLNLWHRRLAHHHPRGISEGITQGLIDGPSLEAAKSKQRGLCSACERSKSHRRALNDGRRAPHTKATSSSTLRAVKKTIRSVVTDLKGPFSVKCPHGELYLQLFTDCDDKWRVVKFLTKKSDSLHTLQDFFLVDVQAEGLKVENLHADGAPELISAALVALVAKQGGSHLLSGIHTGDERPGGEGQSDSLQRRVCDASGVQPPSQLLGVCGGVCGSGLQLLAH